MSQDHFYVYMPSHGDTAQVFKDNQPNEYSIPLDNPIELPLDRWEVGLAELNMPNNFYNIDESMNKIIVGNPRSEYRFEIPVGHYSPEQFCDTLNLILTKIDLIYKQPITDLKGNIIQDPVTKKLCVGLNRDEYHTLDLDELADRRIDSDLWDVNSEGFYKTTWKFHPGYNYSIMERYQKFAQQGVQALITPPSHVEDEKEENKRQGLIRQGITRLESRHHRAWDVYRSYRKSQIRFHYNRWSNKMSIHFINGGVKDEYIIFQNDKLPHMMGFTESQLRILADDRPEPKESYTDKIKGEYHVDFEKFIRHIYLYTDIIHYSRVGAQYAPILKYMALPTVKKRDADVLQFKYEKPQYFALKGTSFPSITLSMRDDWGDPIMFKESQGRVLAILHFRKKRTQNDH